MNIPIAKLHPHPRNRTFATTGPKWDEFLESIRLPGRVFVKPIVRAHGKSYQILAGHRRHLAAQQLGLKTLECEVVEMTDRDALEFLVSENMQRADLTPVDEARFVEALAEELDYDPPQIAVRLARSVQWVETRQCLLSLDDEVRARVSLPAGDTDHVTIGAIQAIMSVPESLRTEAVQMVLHPELSEQALNERQARDVLRRCLVEPWQERMAWEDGKERLLAEARKQLKSAGIRETTVIASDWQAREHNRRLGAPALECPPEELRGPGYPGEKLGTWGHLAARHGLPVTLVPDATGEEALLVVARKLLMLAETTAAENGGVSWLIESAQKLPRTPTEETKRIAAAQAALDGDPDPDYEADDEAPETVITQEMRHFAMIDLTVIKRLGRLATCIEQDRKQLATAFEPWVPDWAIAIFGLEKPELVSDIAEWVMLMKANSIFPKK